MNFQSFQNASTLFTKIGDRLDAVFHAIAENDFDYTQSYDIGDIVWYQDKLYTFTSAHLPNEPWSSAEVTEITAEELVDFATSEIGNLSNLTTIEKTSIVDAINEIATALTGKQDTLTFDTTPTKDSTNPVTSGGIYDKFIKRSVIPPGTSLDTITDFGTYYQTDALSGFTGAPADAPAAAFILEVSARDVNTRVEQMIKTYDSTTGERIIYARVQTEASTWGAWCRYTVNADQQRQEVEIGAVANAGAKNLFKNTASSSTNVTVNSDGTVIVDTADAELTANLSKTIGSFSGVSGEKYILSGCPSGGSSSTWRITLSGVAYDYGDGFEFTADGQAHSVIVWVKSGQTISDLVFKPMIRSASITDSTFVPYAPTNRELYDDQLQQEAAIGDVANSGAKNLWKLTIPSSLPSGFTITEDTDGGYIFNGTAGTSGVTCTTNVRFKSGKSYILSGCPSGGSDSSYRIDILRGQNSNFCYGDPIIVDRFTTTEYPVRVRIAPNYQCDNLKFYPMLRYADISDDTFVPYAPTNRELYEMILAMQNGGNS